MLLTPSQSRWFYSISEKLRRRSVMQDLFAIVELPTITISKVEAQPPLSRDRALIVPRDKIVLSNTNDEFENLVVGIYNKFVVGISSPTPETVSLLFIKEQVPTEPVFSIYDEIPLSSEYVPNYTSTGKIENTTLGRYILNFFVFIHPFEDLIPFHNEDLSPSKVEKLVAQLYINKIVDLEKYEPGETTPHDIFMRNFYSLGGYGDLFIPTFSVKSLQTSPEVEIRRKELLEQYKDQLDDPAIASKIEDELIALDKAWLEDDVSFGFYGSDKKKFDVHRKKQFLVGGITESFGTATPEIEFITTSLSEGWSIDNFPQIANEIRKGSYDRGIETALGGEQTKYLLRIFQNTKITEEDCGTLKGLEFILTPELKDKFKDRYIVVGTKLILLTDDNIDSYVGKRINLRSIMYCKSKPGVCYKCAGKVFEQLGADAIGVFVIDIGTTFLLASMKSMHGTKTTSFKIEDVTDYMVDVT